MVRHRGMEIADPLRDVLAHMHVVDETREALLVLAQRWDMLNILSRVIETDTEVTNTRDEFRALNDTLINALAEENLKKVSASLSSKAQVTVDIVIRNLFERTADIGFLATDEDIRAFLSGATYPTAAMIRQRLIEYQRKYSVYENIVVMDATGVVRAQASDTDLPERCADGFIERSIRTTDAYVESFERSDLAPGRDRALIYAYRVAASHAPTRPIGVLALLFRFADELDGVFRKLLTPQDWTVLTLLDRDGTVLASSDSAQFPVGSRLAIEARAGHAMIRHAGRRYLAAARETAGYQGYSGPGWRGCALVPVEVAFETEDHHATEALEPWHHRAIAGNRHLFSDAVRDIPQRAQSIQAELNRTVWNGAIALQTRDDATGAVGQDVARRTLLSEISATGAQTRQLFADAIATLNQTAISAIVADCAFSAALAVDIMDRNLYERANDCRWWALTTRFRDILAKAVISPPEQAELAVILGYINGLYTVYTNILLFDRAGTVVAVSDPAQAALVGTAFPAELVGRFLRADSGFYGVSGFDPTPLYGGQATYIYGASVLHPAERSTVVGGIAIVFDAGPQFRSMLDDASPTDAAGRPLAACRSLFVDGQGRIIASTSARDAVGAVLDLPLAMVRQAGDGASSAGVVAWGGNLIAVGVGTSAGYREYKGPDDAYRNAVFALCLVDLAVGVAPAATARAAPVATLPRAAPRIGVARRQIATFLIGDRHLAFDCDDVVEAMIADQLVGTATQAGAMLGYGLHGGKGIVVLEPRGYLSVAPSEVEGARPVIVLRTDKGHYGVRVDMLGEVLTVAADQVREAGVGDLKAVKGILRADIDESAPMILLLDPDGLVDALLAMSHAEQAGRRTG